MINSKSNFVCNLFPNFKFKSDFPLHQKQTHPKTNKMSRQFQPRKLIPSGSNNYCANENTHLHCYYCDTFYKINTFAGHFTHCRVKLAEQGQDVEKHNEKRKARRRIYEQRKKENDPLRNLRNARNRWESVIKQNWEETHPNATYEEVFLGVCDDNPFFWDQNTLPELLNRDARQEFFRKMKKSFTDCLVDANNILNKRDDIDTDKQRFFMTIQAFQPLKETLREMEPT